ncbi:MAG TPA: nucleoside hydrolase [Gaiellaceae bacterium]|nr:nucleoside hydrolase [Gaiellaceae bacterium]
MKIVLDCDPGHDDAIALLLALASPEVELLGVTTVHGNQTLEKTTTNALKLLEFVGRTDVPVAAGADRPIRREAFVAEYVHGESGLDGPALPDPTTTPVDRHAVDFLADTLLAAGEPVTLVPTGPLTNIGLFLARHPEAAARIDRVVLMGGAIGEGNVTPAAEFNIWCDPEAADRVFSSGLDVTMIGLDVTHKALVGPAHAEQLRGSGRVGAMVAELLDFYGRFHRETYGWEGSPIHDAVALAHAFKPGLVQTVRTGVRVDCDGELGRGRTNADLRGRMGWEPNAEVGVDIDADGFVALLLERIASLA